MKKRLARSFISIITILSLCVPVYANDAARQTNSISNAEEILEQMENLGFWEKGDVLITRSADVTEYVRYDGQKTNVTISEESGNEIVTFQNESKVNTVIITPNGEYYLDEVADHNKIEVNITYPETTVFAAEPRITTETWLTNTTPYDNGPYTYNKNMTENICVDLNQEIGGILLDAVMFILVPQVPILKYFEKGTEMLDEFSTLSDLVSIFQGECPFCEFVFIQDKYYNGDSDTSGRPLEYCYQVWTRVAETDSFKSFFETVDGLDVQISYAKQLIYA